MPEQYKVEMNNSQNIQTTLKKLLPLLKKLLPTLKSFLPALIVALAVMIGLLGGAKIISNGIVEANRFQFIEVHEEQPKFFDTATGAVYSFYRDKWSTRYDRHGIGIGEIKSAGNWVRYLERTKQLIKD